MSAIQDIKQAAIGRWPELLGLAPELCDGKGHPCPDCGGKDRFSVFKDFERTGGVICRKCHAKQNQDGIETYRWLHGVSLQEAIKQLGEKLGLDNGKQKKKKPKPKVVGKTEYEYHDPDGKLAYTAIRMQLDNGDKSFRQHRPGQKGMNGKPPEYPYHLPELIETDQVTLFIVEGEKDVETLESHDLFATTNIGGAGKWKDHYNQFIGDDRTIYILADNDEPGRKHAEAVKQSLGRGKVINLPRLQHKQDVTDWFKHHGGSREELFEVCEAKQEEPAQWILQDQERTDNGLAGHLINEFGDKLRFLPERKNWVHWDGRRWKHDSGMGARQIARQFTDLLWQQLAASVAIIDRTKFGQLQTFIKGANSERRITAVLRLAECDERMVHYVEQFDSHPTLFNVRNGVIDLDSGKLMPHDPKYLLTQLANVDFEPDARAPEWEQTIAWVFDDDQDLIRYFRQVLGYSLYGGSPENILSIWYGNGNNGKSTVWNTLNLILADYAMTAPQELILPLRHDNPHDRAELLGKRFVMVAEPDENRTLAESQVKMLTGNDRIQACRKYEHPINFSPTHMLCMATNHKPKIRGTDEGIWRRIRLVPFEVDLSTKTEPKQGFSDWLVENEASGILNWMLEGYRDWRENGFIEPLAVREATLEYRSQEDQFQQFIDQCCVIEANCMARANELHSAFTAAGFVMNKTKFYQALKQKFESARLNNGVVYRGIGLADLPT